MTHVLNLENALQLDADLPEKSSEENSTFAVTLPSRTIKEVERLVSSEKTWQKIDRIRKKDYIV